MKQFFILIFVTLFISCAEEKKIGDKVYQPYGLVNEDTHMNDSILYKPSVGSIVCAVVFSETIIVPIYVIGWDFYEPIGKLKEKGVVE